MTSHARRRLAAIAAAFATTLTLAACGDDGGSDAGDDVEQQVEDALESVADQDGAGEVDIETGGDLPEGFPEDDVPVLEDGFVSGSGVDLASGGKSFTLLFNADDQDAAFDEAVKMLEQAGFEGTGVQEIGGNRVIQLAQESWRVGVSDSVGGIIYQVTPNG